MVCGNTFVWDVLVKVYGRKRGQECPRCYVVYRDTDMIAGRDKADAVRRALSKAMERLRGQPGSRELYQAVWSSWMHHHGQRQYEDHVGRTVIVTARLVG